MMRQVVDRCPDDLWAGGEHPRNFWRVAYHAIGYAHLYLYDDLASWPHWEKHNVANTVLEGDTPVAEPYSREELLALVDRIDGEVDARIDALDLDKAQCGYTWYPGVSQVELLILSLRHLHGHIGQLSERLIEHGIDTDWMGPRPKAE